MRRTYHVLVFLALLQSSSMRGDTSVPAAMDDAALKQEIIGQVRAIAAAAEESARLKTQLTEALAAYRQQQEKRRPVAERLSDPTRKIAEIDAYHFVRALPPQLDAQIATLTDYIQYVIRDLQRGRTPRGFTWDAYRLHAIDMDRYLQRLIRMRAVLKERLPTLRPPAFVPAGAELAAFRAALVTEKERIEAELRPLTEELARREGALRDLMGREAHQDKLVREATSRYFLLLFTAQQRFRPPHLAEVRLYAKHDPRAAERLYYHAVVEDPAELVLIDAKIDQLVEHLPTMQAQVDDAFRLFKNAERRFSDVAERWQVKNEQNRWILYKEYTLNGLLELADSTIGIAGDGGNPAAFLFEGVWRTVEFAQYWRGVENQFRVADPTLSEELLAYRQRLSEQLTPGAGREAPALPGGTEALISSAEQQLRQTRLYESLAGSADQFINDQKNEAFKGAISTVSGTALEKLAKLSGGVAVRDGKLLGQTIGPMLEWLAEEAIKSNKKLTTSQVTSAIFMSALTPDITREKLIELLPTGQLRHGVPEVSEFLRNAAPSRTDKILRQLKDLDTYKDVVKGFAIGAIVTAEKQAIKDSVGYANERAQLMAEMALLDIEWFGRRAEYTAAGHFHRQMLMMQTEHRALIGSLFADRAKLAERKLTVRINKTFSTLETIDGELRFSGVAKRAAVRIGGREVVAEAGRDPAVLRFSTGGVILPAGEQAIAITLRPAPGESAVAFDANPLTVVRYVGPKPGDKPDAKVDELWAGVDNGADELHRIKVEAPTLTVIDDGGKGYVSGDWVAVSYKLPGSLSYRGIRLTATPMEKPVEVWPPQGVVEGRLQFQLPLPPRQYRLMLVGGAPNRPDQAWLVAEAPPVTAGVVVERVIARDKFSVATQYDLPSRGQWFEVSDKDIPAEKGRLAFDRRDAASQRNGEHITVRLAGQKQAVWSGWGTHIDLPPGNYTVIANYSPDLAVENVQVEAGKLTTARFSGYGRMKIVCRDGLGATINPHIAIYPDGVKNAIWTGWARQKDLPPGKYRVVLDYVVDIEQDNVEVTAGRETRIEAGGYGRFLMPAVDGVNQRANPHRSIIPAGGKKAIWGGWSDAVDVPPGDYTVVFDYPQPARFENQRVEPGRPTTVEARGYGRLSMPVLNAAGKPVNPHRAVHVAGSDTTVWGGWSDTVDLLPGAYEIRWRAGDKDMKAAVQVTAGQVATVQLRVP